MAGTASQRMGASFEKEIERSFEGYSRGHVARLDFMPTPVRQIGMRDGVPMYVRTGKAPFDVYGYRLRDAVMIGAELKANSHPQTSLALVGPEASGSGVQFHQLDALAGLAQAGGMARLVWDNGGEILVLTSAGIVTAWQAFTQALTSERSNRTAQPGAKSIKPENFTPVDYTNLNGIIAVDWLLADVK